MADLSLAEQLRDQDFFGHLTEKETQLILGAMTVKEYAPNETLISAGEPQVKMFLIHKGTAIKTRGTRVITLTRGQIAGILHFFQKDPSSSTIKAGDEGVTVGEIDSDTFHKLLSDNPELNNQFIAFLSRQVRSKLNIISDIRTKLAGKSGVRVAFFDAKSYMREAFDKENAKYNFDIVYFKEKLKPDTVSLASSFQAVCCFVNDVVNEAVIEGLHTQGVGLVALRCAGYDNVDLKACKKFGISVTRVPAYSPYAVAEFTAALLLTLARKTHKAYTRVREHNFSLSGLVGFDLYGKTVGVLGTGKIGKCFINIMRGFGCNVLCYDIRKDPEIEAMPNVKYVSKDEIFANSDIISLHTPLLPSTYHTINAETLSKMKPNALIINTGRGGLVDAQALLDAILSGKIAGAALDVYEKEKEYFFENKSDKNIADSTLARLIACHNVIVTSHQAFLTNEALQAIAASTLSSINEFAQGKKGDSLTNAVKEEYN